MWHDFLAALAAYAEREAGGVPTTVSKFLRLGAAISRATKHVKEELEAATAKVQVLVDEDRQPTDEELAAVDTSIEGKLKAIGDVDVGAGGTDPT